MTSNTQNSNAIKLIVWAIPLMPPLRHRLLTSDVPCCTQLPASEVTWLPLLGPDGFSYTEHFH